MSGVLEEQPGMDDAEDAFRNIEPLDGVKGCNAPGPAPEIRYLEPVQLVVNEGYQRKLSRTSIVMIRRMATKWDWSAFKAPSVAKTDDPDIYEVVDGQHTAIAAATNGSIPFLPCLVMSAETVRDKAAGFLGINKDRIALTKAAIYRAQVAAEDTEARAVAAALEAGGARILDFPPPNGAWKVGDTMAIATLMELARRKGERRLRTVLSVAVEAHAAPVSSAILKALDLAMPQVNDETIINRVTVVLRSQVVSRLEEIAKSRTPHGGRAYETLADIISDLAKLPGKRLGKPAAAPRGRPRSAAA